MPNGFIHPTNLDVLILAHTSQGYPSFCHEQFYEGFRAYHLLGHRGYAPSVEASALVEPAFRNAESEEEIEALVPAYAKQFAALLTSDPGDALHPTARRACLAWLSFRKQRAICVGYTLYQRKRGGAWEERQAKGWPVPGPLPAEYIEQLRKLLGRPQTIRFGTEGLAGSAEDGGPIEAACFFDIAEAEEILCSSIPLRESPQWPQMDEAPGVFSRETSGLLLDIVRGRATHESADVLVLRWQREEPRRRGG